MVGLIDALIIIPVAGAVVLYIGRPKNPRIVAFIFNTLSALFTMLLWLNFDATVSGLQLL
ncbi:MAG: hypothetical protein JO201_05150, partial [Verrucomicrobia bacterium]|nr:hypothetical protein [Verrucomicrobiota bacterium]